MSTKPSSSRVENPGYFCKSHTSASQQRRSRGGTERVKDAYVVEGTVSSDTDRVLRVGGSIEEALFANDGGDTTGRETSSTGAVDKAKSADSVSVSR